MSFIAIVGAGAVGGALAQRLASRGRIDEVRLVDDQGSIAQGKALDIQQSGAVDGFTTRVTGASSIGAVAGAAAIVIADAAAGDAEHAGEAGLALVKKIVALETRAPLIFAGNAQRWLIARAEAELHVSRPRLIGSAPSALESAVRALAAIEADGSAAEMHLRIVGVPPGAAVIAWEEATASGQPMSSMLPAHRLAAISARLPRLWPLGPFALASAAARVAEAAALGSRRRYSCFVCVGEGEMPAAVLAMPVEIGLRGVARVLRPSLTRKEQTLLDNAAASA
jgi:malate dehydrogenase